jgi:Ca2+-binding RTX toxin-like protein
MGAISMTNLSSNFVKQTESQTKQNTEENRQTEDNPINYLRGTLEADTLLGTEGADMAFGKAGNDLIITYGGNDILYGHDGNDSLSGGDGNDYLYGYSWFGISFGQSLTTDDDLLSGGNGNDHIYGNVGDDILSGDAGNDYLEGGEGNDSLLGGTGNDTLLGGDGDDTIESGYGTNTVDYYLNGNGASNNGQDTLSFAFITDQNDDGLGIEYKDANSVSFDDNNSTSWNIDEIEIIIGSDYEDLFAFTFAEDLTIYAGEGNDTIEASDATTTLYGNEGDDIIYGGAGDDTIYAGSGDDTLDGGEGTDSFLFTHDDHDGNTNIITNFSREDNDIITADLGSSVFISTLVFGEDTHIQYSYNLDDGSFYENTIILEDFLGGIYVSFTTGESVSFYG